MFANEHAIPCMVFSLSICSRFWSYISGSESGFGIKRPCGSELALGGSGSLIRDRCFFIPGSGISFFRITDPTLISESLVTLFGG